MVIKIELIERDVYKNIAKIIDKMMSQGTDGTGQTLILKESLVNYLVYYFEEREFLLNEELMMMKIKIGCPHKFIRNFDKKKFLKDCGIQQT